MRRYRNLSRLAYGLLLGAACASAQVGFPFSLRVDQDGRAFTVSNGATVTLNSTGVGVNASARINITFIGSGTANFSSFDLSGSPEISFVSPGGSTLTPGQSTFLDVIYTPAAVQGALAQLSIPFQIVVPGSPASSGIILLSLSGTVPELVLSYVDPIDNNAILVPNGGSIRFPQSLLNLAIDSTLTVTNRGSGFGRVNGISVSGSSFLLVGLPLFPVNLAAGSELRMTLRFLPRTVGEQTGSLQVALTAGSLTASLSGESLRSFFAYELVGPDGIVPLEPDQPIVLPPADLGTRSSVVVRLRNIRSLPAQLSVLTTTGAPFTVSEAPPLPLALQQQQGTSFRLNFRPTEAEDSAGYLLVNTDTFPVLGRGLGPLITLSYRIGGVPGPAGANGIFFPPTAPNTSRIATVTLTNEGTSNAPVASIAVLDPTRSFRLVSTPALPTEIEPDGTLSVDIEFRPTGPGQSTGTLAINGSQIALTGFAEDVPNLPSYRFTGASGTQEPFTQPAIGLALNSAYPTDIVGTLTLDVIPELFSTDPAVQFSTGGTVASFRIPAGSLDAVFANGSTQIRLQTGSVAAQLVLTPEFATANGLDITPADPQVQRIVVPSRGPTLVSGRTGTRTLTSLSLVISGYVSSRTLQSMSLEFVPREGADIEAAQFTIDLAAESRQWFQSAASQTTGGQFSIEVPFSFSGGSTDPTVQDDLVGRIATVNVTVTNELGTSNRISVVVP